MEYQPRFYCQQFNPSRFASFMVHCLETDLWVGVDHGSFRKEIAETVRMEMVRLRRQLDEYILLHPDFGTSMKPAVLLQGAAASVAEMCRAGVQTGTGLMASVAGLFALVSGEKIRSKFRAKEVVVENGGDCYLFVREDLSIDAWATALANRVKTPDEIKDALTYSEHFPEILSLVVICGDKTGIRGNFEVRFIYVPA